MTACRYDRDAGYRVIPGRHHELCDGGMGDCPGCQPCPEDHCGQPRCDNHCDTTHPLTCPTCVGDVRNTLARILALQDGLTAETWNRPHDSRPGATRLLPMGGEAMTMLGPVSRGQAMLTYALWARDYEDLEYASIIDDPPLLVLTTWEATWRDWLGQPTTDKATLWRVVDYLGEHLTMMAQAMARTDDDGDLEFAPDFTEFTRDVIRVQGQLENVLAESLRSVRGVPCFDCGTDLRQVFHDPDPCDHDDPPCGCDQGGRRDHWQCPKCKQVYDPERYKRAKADAMADVRPLRSAGEIEALHGIRPHTLRQWVKRGHIGRHYDNEGHAVYDIHEVRRHAMHGGQVAS